MEGSTRNPWSLNFHTGSFNLPLPPDPPDVNLASKEGRSINVRISGVSRMLIEQPLPKATDPYCAAIARKAL